jgi:hypothetical protein
MNTQNAREFVARAIFLAWKIQLCLRIHGFYTCTLGLFVVRKGLQFEMVHENY